MSQVVLAYVLYNSIAYNIAFNSNLKYNFKYTVYRFFESICIYVYMYKI